MSQGKGEYRDLERVACWFSSISCTRAQGIPKYSIGLSERGKDVRVWEGLVDGGVCPRPAHPCLPAPRARALRTHTEALKFLCPRPRTHT
jgi:hypothetical protein